MKTTVTIDSRGVVALPARLRQAAGLKADDRLIAETTPGGLLLRPAVTLPIAIDTAAREQEFDEAEIELAGSSTPLRSRRTEPAASADSVAAVRVFLDADIFFSAAKSDGAVRALLHLLLERDALVTGDRRHFAIGHGHASGRVMIHSLRSSAERILETGPLGQRPGPGIVRP